MPAVPYVRNNKRCFYNILTGCEAIIFTFTNLVHFRGKPAEHRNVRNYSPPPPPIYPRTIFLGAEKDQVAANEKL
jgi:hypothetical protein